MKLRMLVSCSVIALLAACAGGEPGEGGEEAAKPEACPGAECPDVRLTKEPTKHPAKVTVPDLKLSVAKSDFKAWPSSAQKLFIDAGHSEEIGGGQMGLAVPGLDMVGEVEATDDGISVVLFDPVTKEAVGQLNLGKKGFVKFNRGALEANDEKVSR
jgi:hypothetical protein